MRASEKYVIQVFRFFLAPDTSFTHREGFVRSDFVPYSSQSGLYSTVGAFVTLLGTLFKVSEGLSAKTGFQAREVRKQGEIEQSPT
eukprot:5786107-Amphidinium_carterae.4